jgi:hypothetical protein
MNGYSHEVNDKEHVQQLSCVPGYCSSGNPVLAKWDHNETPNGMYQCGDNDSPQLMSWVLIYVVLELVLAVEEAFSAYEDSVEVYPR